MHASRTNSRTYFIPRTVAMLALGLAVIWAPAIASAQGLLVDNRENHQFRLPRVTIWPGPRPPRHVPPQTYKIQELGIDVNLKDQVARIQVSQSFVNTGSRQIEVSFVFPLPYDGAVDRMTFLVDGKEYEAKLLTAAEARRIYESHIRRNQDPALMEWMGTGIFKTSVFPVPPGAKRTVTLRYNQLCRKQNGLTDLLLPLSTAKYTAEPVENININVTIQSQARIKNVYSPSHAIEIQRPTDNLAMVSLSRKNDIPTSDFRLMYDIGDAAVGASLISFRPNQVDDGYFLLLVSPEIKRTTEEVIKKNIIFVVDRSGSMGGKKIEQAKGALRFVLNNLNDGDLFNIIAYDSSVESFKPEMQRFTDDNRKAALGFVEGIFAGGSTNIDGALQAALAQLQDDTRPNYIVFMTDGLPTAGEKNEIKIVRNAGERNKVRSRIFSFGVGFDVNSRLLDKLSRSCFGQSQYVRPSEDIEAYVSQLYSRIGAPVMTNLDISFDLENFPIERGSPVSRVYPRDAFDLFAGDQLALVGRYKAGGVARIVVKGKVANEERKFEFGGEFVGKSPDETGAFVEKLWATRRVGEIIDEIDLHGKNEELINELVALSTKHGIITPYTSFLADEDANVRDLAAIRLSTSNALDSLSLESGRRGFVQRELKQELLKSAQSPAPAGGLGGGGFGLNAFRYRRIEDDTEVVVRNVRQVGTKTFLLRDNRWVDSSITPKQIEEVKQIERYSKEYFDLVRRHGKDIAKYLAIEGDVTVILDGQAYSF